MAQQAQAKQAEKDVLAEQLSAQLIQRVAGLTGSESSARQFLAGAAKLNDDFASGKLTITAWGNAINKLIDKAIPPARAAENPRHDQLSNLAYAISPVSNTVSLMPLKVYKKQELAKIATKEAYAQTLAYEEKKRKAEEK